jgi:hypothetical protein
LGQGFADSGKKFQSPFWYLSCCQLKWQGGYLMVGEFVLLTDISVICQWTNTLLVAVACIPFVLFALLHKSIPRKRSELFTLEWKKNYFERNCRTISQSKGDAQQRNRVGEGEGEIQVPGTQDHQPTDMPKRTA